MLLRIKKYKLVLINWARLKCKNQRIRDDNRKTGHGFLLGKKAVVLWRLIFVTALFVCSVCHADPSSEPWEVSVGMEKIKVFQTDYIPLATFFFAYAADDRPDEIVVSPGDITGMIRPQEYWTPHGMPTGAYVFMLNIKTEKVSLMPFGQFKELKTVSERFESLRPDAYPEMNTGGKMVGLSDMVSIRNREKPFVAAVSFDAMAREKTTFGIPSIIPFMGRQKFFQKGTFYSGIVFLDVFEKGKFDVPRVQLKKRFKNFKSYPGFSDLALWVQGADRPILVLIEESDRRYGKKGVFILVEP
jgi:hypothetical protein